jgi:hypothetical protein
MACFSNSGPIETSPVKGPAVAPDQQDRHGNARGKHRQRYGTGGAIVTVNHGDGD